MVDASSLEYPERSDDADDSSCEETSSLSPSSEGDTVVGVVLENLISRPTGVEQDASVELPSPRDSAKLKSGERSRADDDETCAVVTAAVVVVLLRFDGPCVLVLSQEDDTGEEVLVSKFERTIFWNDHFWNRLIL
jgi:hypothetical protein